MVGEQQDPSEAQACLQIAAALKWPVAVDVLSGITLFRPPSMPRSSEVDPYGKKGWRGSCSGGLHSKRAISDDVEIHTLMLMLGNACLAPLDGSQSQNTGPACKE